MPKGRILGVDLNGNIRFRRSKKNPVIITHGIFQLSTGAFDWKEQYEKWKKRNKKDA